MILRSMLTKTDSIGNSIGKSRMCISNFASIEERARDKTAMLLHRLLLSNVYNFFDYNQHNIILLKDQLQRIAY